MIHNPIMQELSLINRFLYFLPVFITCLFFEIMRINLHGNFVFSNQKQVVTKKLRWPSGRVQLGPEPSTLGIFSEVGKETSSRITWAAVYPR